MARNITTSKPTQWQRKYTEPDRRWRQVLDRAVEVFGDESEAILWLKEPKSALQGMTPIQAIKTEYGVQQVELMLGRIEHGIFV
jgi:putative toxin-antitoxin system antitoxin component (TIGR02293 family)